MNSNALWKERFRHFIKEARTYGKYVFNDHLKFIFVFMIGAGAYYYQQWLATLTPAFPTAIVIAVLLGLVVTVGSVQTLLKEADLVYLLPVEERLKGYFLKAFRFTFIKHLYFIAMVAAALAPLYLQQTGQSGNTYMIIVLLAVILKAWNLFMTWEVSYMTDQRMRLFDLLIRVIVNVAFIYCLVARVSFLYIGIFVVLMMVYSVLLQQSVKGKPLNWEYLIAEEGKKMMVLYRIANMFVDVPALKERVARRKWLDFIFQIIGEKRTYLYLYTRTFLRAGNYFGLYMRLLVIGGALVYAIPFLYGRVIVSILFLYLIGYQLMPLWKHHRLTLWLDLYPVREEEKRKDFLKLLHSVLIIGSVILALMFAVATTNIVITGALLAGNIVFSTLFVYRYVAKRIQ